MVGIYKITNPKGEVYIGQSIDIERRLKQYKYCRKGQRKLYKSISFYGYENHKKEVLTICDINDLNIKEIYYQKKYDSIKNGLNCEYARLTSKYKRIDKSLRNYKKPYSINITMDDKTHDKAKQISKNVLGKVNVSGLFTFWINNYKDEPTN